MTMAYIGLGANLDNPVQQVIDARRRINRIKGITDLNSSSLYKTSPVGCVNQPDFVNCVLQINTELSVDMLFNEIQKVERLIGRVRNKNIQNVARRIDVDLLLFGKHSVDSARLRLPHPRIAERLFVLVPLHELDAALKIGKLTVAQHIKAGIASDLFADQYIYKLDGSKYS